MKEHKILIKIIKEIDKKSIQVKKDWYDSDGKRGLFIEGLKFAREIVEKEIEANKERKNIHHKDIQKSSKSISKKKVHSF